MHSTPSVLPSLIFATAVNGTKEDLPCSRRGNCDRSTGICGCYNNYFSGNGLGGIGQRGDCGFVKSTVTACPGEIACSGQGTCRGPPTYDCICNEGFTGGDCSERECPKSKAWFDLPSLTTPPTSSSSALTLARATAPRATARVFRALLAPHATEVRVLVFACWQSNRLHLLVTNDGYISSVGRSDMPERLQRPRHVLHHGGSGQARDSQRERQGWTYGAVPNKKETWDYDMLRGCLCSPGWESFDCSLRSCPTGDDPLTKYLPEGRTVQANEVQELFCRGTSGFFSLRFRDAATPQLPFTTTASALQTALSALSTINDVRVTYSIANSPALAATAPACTATGTTAIRVEFLNDFGDLPPIRWILDGALAMRINVDGAGGSVRGSKEEAECANRGVCNHATGVCKCSFGFTSSDGAGNEGTRGDCGYKEPIYINSAGKVANEA